MLDAHYINVQMTLERCKQLCYNHRYLGLQVSCTQAHFLWKTYETGFSKGMDTLLSLCFFFVHIFKVNILNYLILSHLINVFLYLSIKDYFNSCLYILPLLPTFKMKVKITNKTPYISSIIYSWFQLQSDSCAYIILMQCMQS